LRCAAAPLASPVATFLRPFGATELEGWEVALILEDLL